MYLLFLSATGRKLICLPVSYHISASRSSHVPFNTLATEKRTDFHTTSGSMSATATRSTGRTLRSLPASTTLIHPAEIFTSGAKTIDPPDWTLSPGQPLGAGADGGTGATASSPGSLLASSSSAYTGELRPFSGASSCRPWIPSLCGER